MAEPQDNDDRFQRTRALIGAEKLQKLKNARVMVVGLGAVGGYALEGLARAGIGRLVLVDFDSFELSNINRQILALSSTLGQKKTVIAAQRVKEINPACQVMPKDMFVSPENINELPFDEVDYVVDAIDSLDSKASLIAELVKRNKKFISSMGAALKTDPSKIKICRLNQTSVDGLAKQLRHRLKDKGVDLTQVKCVSSTEEAQRINSTERQPLGSLPTITAIFGLTIANELIKEIIEE